MRVILAAGILALAALLRIGAFWAPHTDPVELAYATLAMKMGTHPGLSGYHPSGAEVRRSEVAEIGGSGRLLPVASPVTADPAAPASFDVWPVQDSNPFQLKAPFFPSLLAYTHHQTLGPRFPFYPLSAAEPSAGEKAQPSRAVLQMQGWAVLVPFVSGLAAVLLTLIAGWRMFGPASGILAAALVALVPAHILISTRIWPEATLSALILAAVVLFHRFISNRNAAGCLLAGACWGIAALTDASAFLFLPAFAVWAFWAHPKPLNGYCLAFAAGAAVIYKVWPDYAHAALKASVVQLSDVSASVSAGLLPGVLPVPVEAAMLCFVPAAALLSTGIFLKNYRSARADEREGMNVGILWLLILSFAVSRWLISREAVWDARAIAPILPFAALLAARKWRIA